jgi:3-oxoacyl-[acyl-carrier-protein] synthase-3
MTGPDVGLAAAVVHLPPTRVTARGAGIAEDAATICDFEEYKHIPVGRGNPVEDWALPAARAALSATQYSPGDIDLVLYAWTHHQGNHIPMPHARLARLLGAHHATAIGIQQMSGGAAAAVETAAALLATGRFHTTLVATADIFDDTPQTRWVDRGHRGIALGDGATATILDTSPHRLAITSIASAGRPDAELQFFASFAPTNPPPGSTDGHTLRPPAIATMRDGVTDAVTHALKYSGLTATDPRIRAVMFTRLGRTLLRRIFYPGLPPGLPRPISLTAETGHLGAGDLIANLAHLNTNVLLAPDEYALLVSVGMGFNANAIIIRAQH